jgi:hypothetical protein
MRAPRSSLLFVLCGATVGAAGGNGKKPKYGPEAIVLSRSHEALSQMPAPDYWALSPYYVGQQGDQACSLASITMVVNAARVHEALAADDELVSQARILEATRDAKWTVDVGPKGKGVTLDRLRVLAQRALEAFHVPVASVELLYAADDAKSRDAIHRALVENEKSDRDFIIANFVQGAYTGDAPIGHVAPVAAYDGVRHRVLILDPDRRWYEPYWVSEETFRRGMLAKDGASGHPRGLIWIHLER